MKTLYIQEGDVKKVRELGKEQIDRMKNILYSCGYSMLEQELWSAYDLGYEAGKKHADRVKETGRE